MACEQLADQAFAAPRVPNFKTWLEIEKDTLEKSVAAHVMICSA